jgi:glycosyltransferase involved in cell wall biosynthesis
MFDTDKQMSAASRSRPKHRAAVVRVGASRVWFEALEKDHFSRSAEDRPLHIIYFGTYVPLHGTPVFAAALADCLSRGLAINLTLVGVGAERRVVNECLSPFAGSVEWHDWMNEPELARRGASSDLSLGIFGKSKKALRVVPNKAYQSIAAGTPVVTSRTVTQQRMLGQSALYVRPGSVQSLVKLFTHLSSDRTRLEEARLGAVAVRSSLTPQTVAREFERQLTSRQ